MTVEELKKAGILPADYVSLEERRKKAAAEAATPSGNVLLPSQAEFYQRRAGDGRYTPKTATEVQESFAQHGKDYTTGTRKATPTVAPLRQQMKTAPTVSTIYKKPADAVAMANLAIADLQSIAQDADKLYNAGDGSLRYRPRETSDRYIRQLETVRASLRSAQSYMQQQGMDVKQMQEAQDWAQELIDNLDEIRITQSDYDEKSWNESIQAAREYNENAAYDLEGTAAAFMNKTDIVSRQTDYDTLHNHLVSQRAAYLRENARRNGLVGTSDRNYEEQAQAYIDAEVARLAELDPNSKEFLSADADLQRLATAHRRIREALDQQGYETYDEFKTAYDAEDAKRKRAANIQEEIAMTETATTAADFDELSVYDPAAGYGAEYRFINGEALTNEMFDALPELFKNIRQYMTENEIAIYNYYYAKRGKAQAEEYLRVLEDSLSSRKASKLFKRLEGDGVGKWFKKMGFGAIAGLDQFAGGVKNFFSDEDEYIPASAVQKASSMVREDLYGDGGAGGIASQGVYDIITAASNMAPTVLTSVAASTLTKKLTGSTELAAKVGKTVGHTIMGVSASGNAYAEAINNGYSKEQARTYATLVGASEVCLESIIGGIPQLGGAATGRVLKAVNSIDNALLRLPLKFTVTYASEGFEEGLQDLLTPVFKRIAADEREEIDWGSVAQSFVIGGFVGVMYGGSQVITADISQTRIGADLVKTEQMREALQDLASSLSVNGEAYTLAQELGENTSAHRAGAVFDAMCEELGIDRKMGYVAVVGNAVRLQMDREGIPTTPEATISAADTTAPVAPETATQPIKERTMIDEAVDHMEELRRQNVEGGTQYGAGATIGTNAESVSPVSNPSQIAAQTPQTANVDAVTGEPVYATAASLQGKTYQDADAMRYTKAIGRDVYFYKGDPRAENGFAEDGKIYVNTARTNPLHVVIAHELTHTLQNTAEYGELVIAIKDSAAFRDYLREKGTTFHELVQTKINTNRKAKPDFDATDAEYEIFADFVGNVLIHNEQHLTELATRQPQWFAKLREFVSRILTKLGVSRAERWQIESIFARAHQAALASEAQKNPATESGRWYSVRDVDYDSQITEEDVLWLHTIGRKSVNDFTSEDLEKAAKWARKFYGELGIKSPFFRAWFGDWRAFDKERVSVIQATNGSVVNSGKGHNIDMDRIVSWNRQLIGETINHAVKDKVAVAALRDIKSVIESAVLLNTEVSLKNSNSKQPLTAFMHNCYAVYEYNGNCYLLKVYIEEALSKKEDKMFSKAYQFKDIKTVTDLPISVLSKDGGLTEGTPITTYSISDLFALVKQYDPEFKPHPVHEAVIDLESGMPKVFYHGTDALWTEYDLQRNVNQWWGDGIYLTPDPERARLYGDNVIPVYVRATADNRMARQNGGRRDITVRSNGDIIVYSPEQIKSAVDPSDTTSATPPNIGTFSKYEGDIRYSISDEDVPSAPVGQNGAGDAASAWNGDTATVPQDIVSEPMSEQEYEKERERASMMGVDLESMPPKPPKMSPSQYIQKTLDDPTVPEVTKAYIREQKNLWPVLSNAVMNDRATTLLNSADGLASIVEKIGRGEAVLPHEMRALQMAERGLTPGAEAGRMVFITAQAAHTAGQVLGSIRHGHTKEQYENMTPEERKQALIGDVRFQATAEALGCVNDFIDHKYHKGAGAQLDKAVLAFEAAMLADPKLKESGSFHVAKAAIAAVESVEDAYAKKKRLAGKRFKQLMLRALQDKKVQRQLYDAVRDGTAPMDALRLVMNDALGIRSLTTDQTTFIQNIGKRIGLMMNEMYTASEDLDAKYQRLVEIDAEIIALEKYVADHLTINNFERLNSWRKFAMLSNLRTHARNLLSTAAQYPVRKIDDFVAWGLESACRAVLNRFGRADAMTLSRFVTWRMTEHGKSIMDTVKWTAELAVREMRTDLGYDRISAKSSTPLTDNMNDMIAGMHGITEELISTRKVSQARAMFGKRGNILNWLSEKNSDILEKEDQFFFRNTLIDELGQRMTAAKVTVPTQEMITEAREAALYAVFRAENKLSEAVLAFKNRETTDNATLNAALQSVEAAADIILPFVHTPSNLLLNAVDHSPIGFIRTLWKIHAKIKNNENYTLSDLCQMFARNITGVGIWALGVLMVRCGALSVFEDDDDEYNEASGNQEFSLKFFGHKISVDWLQPISLPFLMGAAFTEAFEAEDAEFWDSLGKAVTSTLKVALDQSYFQSVQQVFDTSDYSDLDYGSATILNIAKSLTGQMIPTAVGQMARTVDPTQRKVWSNKKGILGPLETMMNTALSRVPGLSYLLDPKVDMWGEDAKRSNYGTDANAAQQFLVPWSQTKSAYADDITTQALLDIFDEAKAKQREINADSSLSVAEKKEALAEYTTTPIFDPGDIGKNWTDPNGDLISEDEEVVDEATRLLRQSYKAAADLLVPSEEFSAAETPEKIDLLKSMYDDIYEMTKNAFKSMPSDEALDTVEDYLETVKETETYDPDIVNAYATVTLYDGKPLITNKDLCARYKKAVDDVYEKRMKKGVYEWSENGVKHKLYINRATPEELAFIEAGNRERARSDIATLFKKVDAATLIAELDRYSADIVRRRLL